jgi:hypothetical protein
MTVMVGPVGADAQATKVNTRANGISKRVIENLSSNKLQHHKLRCGSLYFPTLGTGAHDWKILIA